MYLRLILFSLLPLLLLGQTHKSLYCHCDGAFSPKDLYDALALKQPAWYAFWEEKQPKVNVKLIPTLQSSLINFYKSNGYYHAQIDKKEDNQSVHFTIKKGAPIMIELVDNTLSAPYKELVSLKKGDIFHASTFIDIKKNIKKKIQEEGYCNALLDTKARIDIEKNIAFLHYNLQTNPRCRFGKITIHAPKNINKDVITSRLYFRENSPYSSQLIKESYSTIAGLEAFDGVQIIPQQKDDFIDVDIQLKEKQKRIRQEIGIGYETNLGLKGIFRWEERNFKGNARMLSFDLKYAQKEKYLKTGYFSPAFIKIPWKDTYYLDLNNEFLYSKYIFENFNEDKIANYLHLLKDYHRFSIDVGLGIEQIKIARTGDNTHIKTGNYLLFFPFIQGIIDSRDSKINPRNGLYASVYLERGLKLFKSSTNYSKFTAEVRLIKTLKHYTFAAKAKLGLIAEFLNTLPESKRFFAGGAFSNRAYGFNRLGATDSAHDETGARTLVDTAMEVSHPLYKQIEGALFYDATMISEKRFHFNIDFVHALGLGLRYITPIGPIKIDFGMNIEHKEDYALHFQIGQSF